MSFKDFSVAHRTPPAEKDESDPKTADASAGAPPLAKSEKTLDDATAASKS